MTSHTSTTQIKEPPMCIITHHHTTHCCQYHTNRHLSFFPWMTQFLCPSSSLFPSFKDWSPPGKYSDGEGQQNTPVNLPCPTAHYKKPIGSQGWTDPAYSLHAVSPDGLNQILVLCNVSWEMWSVLAGMPNLTQMCGDKAIWVSFQSYAVWELALSSCTFWFQRHQL